MFESPDVVTLAPPHPAVEVNPRARFEILFAVLVAMFLSALDQTIVSPVLPKIVTQLHGADYYTWVVTAYLVTGTASIPIYGKLSDFFGRKPLLVAGITIFLTGSLLSGLSQTMWQLIAFRAIQGLGAGALMPISLAVIGDLFTPAERGKYQGLFGAVFGIAFIVGPFLGGFLTDNLSWHWIFFVNLPIGLISLYFIGRLLPTVRTKGARFTLDIAGVITSTFAIVSVLLGLTLAEDGNWTDPAVIGWFIAGFVAFLTFLVAETRSADPMIPLGLFRNRTFAVSAVALFLTMFGFAAAIIFLPLWFQVVQGMSTTASGYGLMPFLLGLMFSSVVSGLVVSRTGHYKWLVALSMVLLVVGMVLFTNLRGDTPLPVLWVWMAIAGLGVGPSMAIFTLIVQNDVPAEQLGTATSDLTLIRQIGMSVGLTMAFTAFRNNLTWDLIRNSVIGAGAPSQYVPASQPAGFDVGSLTSVGATQSPFGQVPPQAETFFVQGFHQAFSVALANSMWIGVVAAALAFVATLALREKALRQTHASQVAPEAAVSATRSPTLGASIGSHVGVHGASSARHEPPRSEVEPD